MVFNVSSDPVECDYSVCDHCALNTSFYRSSTLDSFKVLVTCPDKALSYSISIIATLRSELDFISSKTQLSNFLPVLCYMTPDENGVHSCRDWGSMPSGRYIVSLYLYRRPRRNRECVVQSRQTVSTIFDFISLNNFTYDDVFACFQYGMHLLKEVVWNKRQGLLSCSDHFCLVDKPGAWYAEALGVKTADYFDDMILQSNITILKGMHYFFRPFNCRYKIVSKEKAAYCLLKNRIAYFGDSRDRYMISHIYRWLGLDNFRIDGDQKLMELLWPDTLGYLGWMSALGTGASINKTGLLFRRYLSNNFTLILQGIAHDTAEFPSSFQISDIKKFFPNHNCVSCNATTVGECDRICEKPNPLLLYTNNILALKQLIKKMKREIPGSKIFWMAHHKKPPNKDSDTKELTARHWQMHDIFVSLEDFAIQNFREIGIPIIDLRYMAFSAPSSWWNDALHYGNLDFSGFKHMGMHIFLNHLCT